MSGGKDDFKEEYQQVVFGTEEYLYVYEKLVELDDKSSNYLAVALSRSQQEYTHHCKYDFESWLLDKDRIVSSSVEYLRDKAPSMYAEFILETINLDDFQQELNPDFDCDLFKACVSKFVQYVIEFGRWKGVGSKDKILVDIHEFYTADDSTEKESLVITRKFEKKYLGGSSNLQKILLEYIKDLEIIFYGGDFDEA